VSNHDDRNEFESPAGRFRWADDDDARDLFGLSDAADLDPSAEGAREVAEVRRAIEALPFHEREVIRLQSFEGLTHPEIAERLGIPVGTVKSRSHAAHRRLSRRLEDNTRDLFGLSDAADLALVADLDQLREDLADPAVWIEPPQDLVKYVSRDISAAAADRLRALTHPAGTLAVLPEMGTQGSTGSEVAEQGSTRFASSTGLEIRVLGPLEVVSNGEDVYIGKAKARALIARLLLARGRAVPVDLLASLWGDLDGGEIELLRYEILWIRRRLSKVNASELIVTREPGYLLDLPASNTDVHRFEDLVSEGRRQLGRRRPSEATRLLTEAQGLWRGAAYSDVRDEPLVWTEASRLEMLLLTAIETRLDAQLTMGLHDAVLDELATLTGAYPLRERLWSQRMLALYRSGRQSEALRIADELRRILDEVGIEAGHDVSWLERAILVQDPALDFPAPSEPAESGEQEQMSLRARESRVLSRYYGTQVGRDSGYGQILEWWDSTRHSRSRLLLVDDELQLKPWHLALPLARTIERQGGEVLWVRCDEDPVAPLEPFTRALENYFQSASVDVIQRLSEWQVTELARLVPSLRQHVRTLEEEPGDHITDRYLDAITQTLYDLSARGPVLIVVIDLHWADEPTLHLMREVLNTDDAPNLGIIATYTESDAPHNPRKRKLLRWLQSLAVTVHLDS
jgi:DNA-binding SARP family transcriptional activator/predicted DNA-binding protein (UPF0251 family)